MPSDNGNAVLTEDDDYHVRIDQLVSSALKEQAREKRVLMEAVHAAKSAVTKSQEDLAALRQMLENRDRAVLDLLEARLSGIGTETSIAFIGERIEQIIADGPTSKTVAPVAAAVADLLSRIASLQDAFASIDFAAPVRQLQHAIDQRLSELAGSSTAISGEVARIREEIGGIGPDVDSRLKQMEEALAGDIDVAQDAISQHITSAVSTGIASVVETVGESGSRVSEAVMAFKEMVERQTQEELSKVTDHVKEAAASIDVTLAETAERVREQLDDARAGQEVRNAAVAKHVESVKQIIAEGEAGRTEAFQRLTSDLDVFLRDRGSHLAEAVTGALTPFVDEVQTLGERMKQSNRRITESNTRMEALQESLVAYLAQRDQKMERVRDQAIVGLLEQLGETLKPREKTRLLDAFRDAQQRKADRRDAERYRTLMAGPQPQDMTGVEEEMKAASQDPGVQSLLLAEVEAEMPAIEDTPIPQPEKDLLVEETAKAKKPPRTPGGNKPKNPKPKAKSPSKKRAV